MENTRTTINILNRANRSLQLLKVSCEKYANQQISREEFERQYKLTYLNFKDVRVHAIKVSETLDVTLGDVHYDRIIIRKNKTKN